MPLGSPLHTQAHPPLQSCNALSYHQQHEPDPLLIVLLALLGTGAAGGNHRVKRPRFARNGGQGHLARC